MQGTRIYLIKEPSSHKDQNLFDRRSKMKPSRLRLFSIYHMFIFYPSNPFWWSFVFKNQP